MESILSKLFEQPVEATPLPQLEGLPQFELPEQDQQKDVPEMSTLQRTLLGLADVLNRSAAVRNPNVRPGNYLENKMNELIAKTDRDNKQISDKNRRADIEAQANFNRETKQVEDRNRLLVAQYSNDQALQQEMDAEERKNAREDEYNRQEREYRGIKDTEQKRQFGILHGNKATAEERRGLEKLQPFQRQHRADATALVTALREEMGAADFDPSIIGSSFNGQMQVIKDWGFPPEMEAELIADLQSKFLPLIREIERASEPQEPTADGGGFIPGGPTAAMSALKSLFSGGGANPESPQPSAPAPSIPTNGRDAWNVRKMFDFSRLMDGREPDSPSAASGLASGISELMIGAMGDGTKDTLGGVLGDFAPSTGRMAKRASDSVSELASSAGEFTRKASNEFNSTEVEGLTKVALDFFSDVGGALGKINEPGKKQARRKSEDGTADRLGLNKTQYKQLKKFFEFRHGSEKVGGYSKIAASNIRKGREVFDSLPFKVKNEFVKMEEIFRRQQGAEEEIRGRGALAVDGNDVRLNPSGNLE